MASDTRREDGIEVKAADVAQQRQALKKAAGKEAEPELERQAPAPEPEPERPARRKPGRKTSRKPAAATPAIDQAPPEPVTTTNPVDLIDGVFALAEKRGGMDQLRRLVDRLAQVQTR